MAVLLCLRLKKGIDWLSEHQKAYWGQVEVEAAGEI